MNPTTNNYYSRLRPFLRNRDVQNYSYAAFSVIAITLFVLFAISPAVNTILSLRKTIDEQTTILTNLKTREQNERAGIDQYHQAFDPPTKEKLLSLLPSTTSLPCLIDTINSSASKASVTVTGIQIQPIDLVGTSHCVLVDSDLQDFDKNPGSQPQDIQFTINVQGQYTNFINLLGSLNQSPRLLNIESISVSKQGDSLILSINGNAYFYK